MSSEQEWQGKQLCWQRADWRMYLAGSSKNFAMCQGRVAVGSLFIYE